MFKPLKVQNKIKDFIGFDLEFTDFNQTFLCACFYDGQKSYYFTDRNKAEQFALSHLNKIFIATNLSFDLLKLLSADTLKSMRMIWNGARLLKATWADHHGSVQFWDTLNFWPVSVEKLGETLKIPKLKHPGDHDYENWRPENQEDWEELLIYCARDAEISQRAGIFLREGYRYLGGSMKFTGASTALNIYRTKYLKDAYWTPSEKDALFDLEAYAGGRTEAFARGKIEGCHFYDVNSLYPYVMKKYSYPDPNFMRYKYHDSRIIFTHEGIAKIKIHVPYTRYPVLFVKKDKLLFPCGTLEGTWTHVEIREAVKRGAIILEHHVSRYSKKTCDPFREFVDDIYKKRLEWQHEKDPREKIAKLVMNMSYGKYCQKFKNRENLVPENSVSFKEISRYHIKNRKGGYLFVSENTKPASFCIPQWGAHITAYARLELLNYLESSNALYCDTDSIVTPQRIPTGESLGMLKYEGFIERGVIVRPKFYGFWIDGKEKIVCKGYGARIRMPIFEEMLRGGAVQYKKAVKLRESLRRNLELNRFISVDKTFSLEDTKRLWPASFDPNVLQWSEPIEVSSGDHATKQTRTKRIATSSLSHSPLENPLQ